MDKGNENVIWHRFLAGRGNRNLLARGPGKNIGVVAKRKKRKIGNLPVLGNGNDGVPLSGGGLCAKTAALVKRGGLVGPGIEKDVHTYFGRQEKERPSAKKGGGKNSER